MRFRHVYPFIMFPVLVVGVTARGVVYSLTADREPVDLPKLAVIPPEDVSLVIREWALRFPQVDSDWHPCYQQDGYTVAVRTSAEAEQGADGPGVPFIIFRDSEYGSEYVANYTLSIDKLLDDYMWKRREVGGTLTAWHDRVHCAVGWALSAEACSVIGGTTHGRLFEAPVVGGFWSLRIIDHDGPEIFD